jgi:hypothetical protein
MDSILEKIYRLVNSIWHSVSVTEDEVAELRREVAEVRALLDARPVNLQEGGRTEIDVPGGKLLIAIEYLETHPDAWRRSSRTLGDKIGVSHTYVARAKKYLQEKRQ